MSSHCKVAILGSTGMLGHAVGKYFISHTPHDVHLSLRNNSYAYDLSRHFYFDALEFNKEFDSKLNLSLFSDYDYVINCIGGIKQNDLCADEFRQLNFEFPHKLAKVCDNTKTNLIHVSTDCVFSGDRGNSTELDRPNPNPDDLYGFTKFQGEPLTKCMVIRTSFVGRELHGSVGLLDWAISQKGKIVYGYDNHYWNGLTTQQFAKSCDQIIREQLYCVGVRHIFNPSKSMSKAKMLEIFNRKFNLDLIIKHETKQITIDRTLSTVYDLCSKLSIPSFNTMMENMI